MPVCTYSFVYFLILLNSFSKLFLIIHYSNIKFDFIEVEAAIIKVQPLKVI